MQLRQTREMTIYCCTIRYFRSRNFDRISNGEHSAVVSGARGERDPVSQIRDA